MLGDFSTATEAARDELRAVGLYEDAGRTAVVLGAGVGAHAIALAEAGYFVTGIDTCAQLLDELRAHAGNRAIRCAHDDLLQLRRHCDVPVDVIVCMGDTLTHVASMSSAEQLFDVISEALNPAGIFVATFRNYGVGPSMESAASFPCARMTAGS